MFLKFSARIRPRTKECSATAKSRSEELSSNLLLHLVAGAGFEPTTFRVTSEPGRVSGRIWRFWLCTDMPLTCDFSNLAALGHLAFPAFHLRFGGHLAVTLVATMMVTDGCGKPRERSLGDESQLHDALHAPSQPLRSCMSLRQRCSTGQLQKPQPVSRAILLSRHTRRESSFGVANCDPKTSRRSRRKTLPPQGLHRAGCCDALSRPQKRDGGIGERQDHEGLRGDAPLHRGQRPHVRADQEHRLQAG